MKEYELISLAQKSINAFIEDAFVDEKGDPISSDGNPTNPLVAFKNGLKIDDKDSIHYVIAKMLIALLGTAHLATLIGNEFYGVPKTDYKQSKTGLKKQILFSFKEPSALQKKRKAKNPKRLQIGVNVEGRNINLSQLQEKIKTAFPKPVEDSTANLYFCGAIKYSYFAPNDGLQITQLQSNHDTNAENLVKKICGLVDITYRPETLKRSQAVKPDPTTILAYVALHKVVLIDGKNEDFLVYRKV